ncbi:MAG: FKBP-type peptidyl-prolyl cis-trans isomerase [Chlamydiia bacterium]
MRGIKPFLLGACVGVTPFIWQNLPQKPLVSTIEEEVLAQVIYQDLTSSPEITYRWDAVKDNIESLLRGGKELFSEKEIYEVSTNLSIKASERLAQENLNKANAFIKKIEGKGGVISVVDGFVYAEILKSGVGETISDKDVILTHFKEFKEDGQLVKDTSKDRPYTIALAQTIRGFKRGLEGARVGETRKIYVHPDWGFGKMGGEINQILIYEVTILEKKGGEV